MGKKTDLSLQAIAGFYGSAQPPGKMGFDALRGRSLPGGIQSYQPAALQPMPLPEDWERGGVQTVYFPVSDAIAGTLGYGVEKATGSPTAGFAAELMAPSPTSLAKELAKVVRGGWDDARKIFAGVGAKTANLPKRAEAEQMLAAGVDPAQVWRDTGWAVGPDKKWRFEIPDTKMKVKIKDGKVVVSHPEMAKAYPGFKVEAHEYRPTMAEALAGVNASIDDSGRIFINRARLDDVRYASDDYSKHSSKENLRRLLAHEISHKIAKKEGFAPGGTTSLSGNFDDYLRLAGEADARLIEHRTTKAGRHDIAPFLFSSKQTDYGQFGKYPYDPAYFEEATGVKLSDLILRGEGGAAASVARQTAAPFTLGGIADEIPATVPETAGRVIDDNALRSLRAKATDIEDAARGISVYVTQDGQAIVSKPKSVKTPERIKKFASENNLTYSESQWRMPVSEKYPLHSEPMPTEYRESGAKYWWE